MDARTALAEWSLVVIKLILATATLVRAIQNDLEGAVVCMVIFIAVDAVTALYRIMIRTVENAAIKHRNGNNALKT